MTANQIAWWNIQENIRSHMQNELNTRNSNSITQSLGDEQNRISNTRMENDFVLGQQGNTIHQQQADTATKRAAQDYDIGQKTVANQAIRNSNDYQIGTISNANKAKEISNQYILGSVANQNQSIRNAQDYALGTRQQDTNVVLSNAAMLNAGAQIGKLNPAGVVVALTAPLMQQGVNAGAKKVVDTIKQAKPITKEQKAKANEALYMRGGARIVTPQPTKSQPETATKSAKTKNSNPVSKGSNSNKGGYRH